MKSTNSFGVHFTTRNKPQNGKLPIYARITVNMRPCELSLKVLVHPGDWNASKGLAKPKNEELIELNNHLEGIRSKLYGHYREFEKQETIITAAALKDAFLGVHEHQRQKTLLELFKEHNRQMAGELQWGTMKNYYSTEKYINNFLREQFPGGDIYLKLSRDKLFPYISNQEVNRMLKLVAQSVGITKNLQFHLARRTIQLLESSQLFDQRSFQDTYCLINST